MDKNEQERRDVFIQRNAYVKGANDSWKYVSLAQAERAAQELFPLSRPRVIERKIGGAKVFFALIDGRLKHQFFATPTGLPVHDTVKTILDNAECPNWNKLWEGLDVVFEAYAELVKNPTEAL